MNSFFEKLFFINKKTNRDNEISDQWLENENLLFSNKMKKRRFVIKNSNKEYCPHCYSQKLKKFYTHFFNGHHNHIEESNEDKYDQEQMNNLKIDMTDEKDLYKKTGFFDYVEDKNKILNNNDIEKKINYDNIENNQNNNNEIDYVDDELIDNHNNEYNNIDNNNNIIGGTINYNNNNESYKNNFENNIENNDENNQFNEKEKDNNNQNEINHNNINENEINNNIQNNNNENDIENNNQIKEEYENREIINNNNNNNEDNYYNQNNNYENNNNNEMKILKISKLILSSSSEENEDSINNNYNEKKEDKINYNSNNNQQYNNINNKIDEIFQTVNNPQIIESFSPINKNTQINQYHYISKDKIESDNFKSSPFSFRENSNDEETNKHFVMETEKKPKLILKVNKYFAPDQKLSIIFNQVKNVYKLTKSNQN